MARTSPSRTDFERGALLTVAPSTRAQAALEGEAPQSAPLVPERGVAESPDLPELQGPPSGSAARARNAQRTLHTDGVQSILVVDDDEDARDLLCSFLRSQEFTTVSAANGQEAMDYLQSSKPLPGLMLLDLNMPIVDGFAFREEQLASSDALAHVPVIVMSALPPTDSAGLCVEDVLRKPLSLPLLLDAIRRTSF